jgi:hypothetical protein
VCYFLARPVQGVGILLPGLVPAAVAAVLALIFAPSGAAPVAYVAGVAGPLIGADLLHLKEIEQSAVGMASIGRCRDFRRHRPLGHCCCPSGMMLIGQAPSHHRSNRAASRSDDSLTRDRGSNLSPSSSESSANLTSLMSPMDSFVDIYTAIHGLALRGARRFRSVLP